jgi:DNA modification methylase
MKAKRKASARPSRSTAPVDHIRDLVSDPKNRRKHNPRNIGMIVDALQKVGAARSIVIDEQNEVLAGNGVLEAAAEAGLTKVRVVDVDGSTIVAVRRTGLSAKQKRDLAIYDNRAAELAEWDIEQLRDDLANGEDLSAFFQPDELSALLATVVEPHVGKTDPDAVPAERATDIKPGDLFELGRHRLLCGDCTDPVMVERLMNGARAGLMNTDPPYGIDFDNASLGPTRKKYKAIANDKQDTGEALQRFLESAFGVAKLVALGETAAWYLWHAQLTQGYFAAAAAAAAAAANLVLHRQIIWVKPRLILGRGQYHWKHELCFMGWVDGHQCPDYGLGNGERTQTTVWEVAGVTQAERDDFNHASPKPVELFKIPIVKHLRGGEACYEPFAGSGPQFIAAEQHDVACYGLELEPRFCQVIIDRWEAFTGQKAKKVS